MRQIVYEQFFGNSVKKYGEFYTIKYMEQENINKPAQFASTYCSPYSHHTNQSCNKSLQRYPSNSIFKISLKDSFIIFQNFFLSPQDKKKLKHANPHAIHNDGSIMLKVICKLTLAVLSDVVSGGQTASAQQQLSFSLAFIFSWHIEFICKFVVQFDREVVVKASPKPSCRRWPQAVLKT